jgi:hypothetical protein
MTTSNTVDVSAEAVAERAKVLRLGYKIGPDMASTTADLLSALSAALSEARGKVGEVERERDEARAIALSHFTSTTERAQALTAALAELARLRAENEWRLIESDLPQIGRWVVLRDAREEDDYIVAKWNAEQ